MSDHPDGAIFDYESILEKITELSRYILYDSDTEQVHVIRLIIEALTWQRDNKPSTNIFMVRGAREDIAKLKINI